METTTPIIEMKQDETIVKKIEKLPKWAQDHIKDLVREREVMLRALNDFTSNSKPSPIYIEEYVCTGETSGPTNKRSYIQSSQVNIEAHGIHLNVMTQHGSTNNNSIVLQWSAGNHGRCSEVCLTPLSFQQVRLLAKENMR